MLVRSISPSERSMFDAVAPHPLQSYAWGEFRAQTGVHVERVGIFDQGKLQSTVQVTFHRIPHTSYTAGYFPKGSMPDTLMLDALKDLGRRNHAMFIKLEPNVAGSIDKPRGNESIVSFLLEHGCVPGRPLFTKYTFILSLQKSEEELLASMRPKARYNIGIAQKSGVTIVEDTSEKGMEEYLRLLALTTKRQGFFAHSPEYFRTMWKVLGSSGMLRIFTAVYQGQVLTAWIMFVHNGVLYYPYGASSREHRDVMANNLMMWEMIRFGKSVGCTSFDMWGSLGPDPDPKDPWFGFHRFKKEYGGELTEFIGTYDLVIEPNPYKLFRIVEDWRWKLLRLKAKFF